MEKKPFCDNEIHIFIIGFIKLQNILLSQFIEEKTGFKCLHQEIVDKTIFKKQSSLILFDYSNSGDTNSWKNLNSGLTPPFNKPKVALFNVCPKDLVLEEAIEYGIRGVFNKNDSPFTIAKGVQSILNGELWFSRNTMSKVLSKNMQYFSMHKTQHATLTSREKEILAKLTEGATNSEIADDLCISVHTVKSHLYNMFVKINVSSRLQALLWATKHL